MAYAAYREMLGATLVRIPPSSSSSNASSLSPASQLSKAGPQWFVLDITVHSCDALKVRRALVTCPDTGILRCIPLVDDKRVRLEVRLPEQQFDEVVHRLIGCVPDGEIGHMTSWVCHMQRHGLTHGAHDGR